MAARVAQIPLSHPSPSFYLMLFAAGKLVLQPSGNMAWETQTHNVHRSSNCKSMSSSRFYIFYQRDKPRHLYYKLLWSG